MPIRTLKAKRNARRARLADALNLLLFGYCLGLFALVTGLFLSDGQKQTIVSQYFTVENEEDTSLSGDAPR